jgi:hypothetical protein
VGGGNSIGDHNCGGGARTSGSGEEMREKIARAAEERERQRRQEEGAHAQV